jgi:small subunit ribosomal protein S6
VSTRLYEILFIADPNLGEPEVDTLTSHIQGYVEKENGKVQKVEKWGKKRLAYPIKKHREGSYVLLTVEGGPALVHEVERRIRVTDGIVKFITVRVDEELRKAASRKARRGEDKRPPAPRPEPAEEGTL